MTDSLTIPFHWAASFKPPRARTATRRFLSETMSVTIRRGAGALHVATLADVNEGVESWASTIFLPIAGEPARPRRIVFHDNSYWREIGTMPELKGMIESDHRSYEERSNWLGAHKNEMRGSNTDNPFNLPPLPTGLQNPLLINRIREPERLQAIQETELFDCVQELGFPGHTNYQTRRALEEEFGGLREWDDTEFGSAAARVHARARSLVIIDSFVYQRCPPPVWSIRYCRPVRSEGALEPYLTLSLEPAFPQEPIDLDEDLTHQKYRLGNHGTQSNFDWLRAHNLTLQFNLEEEALAKAFLAQLCRQTGFRGEVTGRARLHATPPLSTIRMEEGSVLVARELVRLGALLLPVLPREIVTQWSQVRDAWRSGEGDLDPKLLFGLADRMLHHVFDLPSFDEEFPCPMSEVKLSGHPLIANMDFFEKALLPPHETAALSRLVWSRASAFAFCALPYLRRRENAAQAARNCDAPSLTR